MSASGAGTALIALLIMAQSLAASPAAAQPIFEAADGVRSGRVQTVDFIDGLVLRITGFVDHPFVVEFDDDVREVAGAGLVTSADLRQGATGGWEVTRAGTRLFVRPLLKATATTVLVATRKGRTVVLDFVPSATPKGLERRVSRVVLKPVENKDAVAALPVASAAASPAAVRDHGPVASDLPVTASLRNESYSYELVDGPAAEILPAEVFDDGRFTWMLFPGNQPVPAIYRSLPGTKEEWLVNSHRDGDYIVLHGVAKLWNLRLESAVVGVFNDLFDASGIPSPHGTSVPGYKRARRQ